MEACEVKFKKIKMLTLLLSVVRDESRLLIDDLLKEFRLLGGRE